MAPSTPPEAPPRVTVLGEDGSAYEVFEVVSYDDRRLVVRASLLFEVGERLRLRIERDGAVTQVEARVAAHDRAGEEVETELALGQA